MDVLVVTIVATTIDVNKIDEAIVSSILYLTSGDAPYRLLYGKICSHSVWVEW